MVGSLHETTTFDPLIDVVGAEGVPGNSAIKAPFPSADSADSPTALVAVIFAYTEAMFGRLKGEADSTVFGMLQLLFALIVALEPSQLVVSVANEPSCFFKRIL